MAKRQRMGWWFLCLACVVVIVCTAQRMAGLHALQMDTATATTVVSAPSSAPDDATPVTPCELSAKSLLAAPPVVFEGAILAFCLLLALLTPRRTVRLPFFPQRVISPPGLRVHLRFCVFRE
ncbi:MULTISPECIES: hypothetical protein [Citrobacter]|uniref:Copper resistance protein n=1 Tax=Citrobacter sedlakii TaxID=67826 RepID=A0ABS0ZVI8_9ENTR|nr:MULTISPECIES: hypothetical protein [Citrobacter]EHG7613552.1 copper resistance protein [Citrobacter sedlakii]EKJ8219407.1 copper resistance protein [Citrobacter sedlakii]MBJ8382800.1 copper resistance protein [Citrobacter sedlakii]MBM9566296.1 copper resistance protein [Citrobacter sedlakii]MDM2752077.1 copper resistance protein [Citrobacter sp. Cs237]